jgi:hypothetical protein
MTKKIKIGWKTSTFNSELASLRYRAIFPLLALEKLGIKSEIYSKSTPPFLADLDVLVIVKSFQLDDYWLAQEAKYRNIPIVFDLCDNIFIGKYGANSDVSPNDIFLLIASLASAITVTTEPLANVVRENVGGSIPIHIIPDGIESKELLRAVKRRLFIPKIKNNTRRATKLLFKKCNRISRIEVKSLTNSLKKQPYRCLKICYRVYDKYRKQFNSLQKKVISNIEVKEKNCTEKLSSNLQNSSQINGTKEVKKILWFGNHGAPHAEFGMLDLLLVQKELENIAKELPVELVVVSNNFEKYRKSIQPFKVPTSYFEWSADSMSQHFSEATVVIIPNSNDSFSICKSANRAVLSLAHGVPVVATSTPALEDLSEVITLNNIEEGIKRCITDKKFALDQVKKGQEVIESLFGQEVIGSKWNDVIDNVISHRNTSSELIEATPELIIAIHLPQDISIAFPVIDEANANNIESIIWVSISAVKRWPTILKSIQEFRYNFLILLDEPNDAVVKLFPKTVHTLLSVTESNLSPHRFTHQLTKLANKAGLHTATMQHGYENIGLSYSDSVHNIKSIKFESLSIYTWGEKVTLHKEILQKTLAKCIPVGCPKTTDVDFKSLPVTINEDAVIIGIFENLHWHRYSDDYRQSFLNKVIHLADIFPDIMFIVKPHNAGMWLTKRYKGEQPTRENLIIADPLSSEWAQITAPHLLAHVAGIITTPSTVALDAARVNIPTAVFSEGLDLNNYAPLSLINEMDDWSNFVNQVIDPKDKKILENKACEFIDKVILPSEKSVKQIVDHIKTYKKK